MMCTFIGPLFQIVFDDRTAPTTLSPAMFKQARAAYLALSSEELTEDRTTNVEPQPRRRAPQATTQETAENQPQSSTTAATITTADDRAPPQPTQTQKRGRLPPPQAAAQQKRSSLEPQQQQQSSSTTTTELEQSLGRSHTTATKNSTTTINSSNISPTTNININVNSSTIISSIITDNNIVASDELLCCAIPDCVEVCNNSTSHLCLNCPPKSRCYIYCPIHELHASHSDQLSSRRTNIPITYSSNTNNQSNNDDNNNNSTKRPARNKKRSLEVEELCMCGCNTMRNSNSLTDCKGKECRNRVNFACVPNTWLCLSCSNRSAERNNRKN
jgi:hypothetical protein